MRLCFTKALGVKPFFTVLLWTERLIPPIGSTLHIPATEDMGVTGLCPFEVTSIDMKLDWKRILPEGPHPSEALEAFYDTITIIVKPLGGEALPLERPKLPAESTFTHNKPKGKTKKT